MAYSGWCGRAIMPLQHVGCPGDHSMATVQEIRDQVRAATAEGDYSRALSLVQRICRHFPEDYETAALLGQIHLEQGRLQMARDAYRKVLEADPEDVLARWALATIAEEEGDLDTALEQLERAFNIDSSNRGLAEEITRLHSQRSHSHPTDPSGLEHALGRQLMALGQHEEAVAQFEVAIRSTSAEEVVLGLAHALWLAGRPKQSEEVARRIISEHPNCVKALALVAGAAFSRGDEEAISLLTRAAALNPGNSVAARLFKEGGLPTPPVGEKVEVPDEEPEEPPTARVMPGEGISMLQASESGELAGKEDASGEGGAFGTPGLQDEEPWAKARPGLRGEGSRWLSDRVVEALGEPSTTVEAGETAEEDPAKEMAEGDDLSTPQLQEGQPGQPLAVIGEKEALMAAAGADPQGEKTTRNRVRTERDGDIALHITFARTFEKRGQIDFALDEYRTALKLERSTAPTVLQAALAIAEADPSNAKARWLAGDALAVEGQFRKAVEQYLMVLKSKG